MATKKDGRPTVLAFERQLSPSDALLHSGSWDDRAEPQRWTPIMVHEKAIRGTISNELKKNKQDPTKVNAEIENPNLQRVDVATLPHDADTLRIHFTLRVLGGTGEPTACNNSAYGHKLQQVVDVYKEEVGFDELATRYAANLANARFAWRNRVGAEQIEVQISQRKDGQAKEQWVFDGFSGSIRDFENADDTTRALGAVIRGGLEGRGHVLLDVKAYIRLGVGQEVFPSQELILDRKSGSGNKSKTLYDVQGIAGVHSQKIGNALRTIDTWYPLEEAGGHAVPIAVEPYGSVTNQGKAYRQPNKKKDFYNLLDRWVLKEDAPEVGQQHFVMAVLVRGGVFGNVN